MPTKRQFATRTPQHQITSRAVDLFIKAIELEATGLHDTPEPEGRQREYYNISGALHNELGLRPWHENVLDVDLSEPDLIPGRGWGSKFYDPARDLRAQLEQAVCEREDASE